MANAIANIVILNEKSNRVTPSNPPEIYIPHLEISNDLFDQQYVPTDPELLKVANYEQFLNERERNLSEACNHYLESLRD
ncbi:MAG: hypothetical protein NTX81_01105 [Candidatus Bathyarchaeota archaeon]|jgi:hypothetical protein|nr:hypothetical protein [Candidatus Bathyarchaeota archaeon]